MWCPATRAGIEPTPPLLSPLLSGRSELVITAPHAACVLGATVRTCDRKALAAAEQLHVLLPQAIYLANTSIYRWHSDLNRASGRQAGFRPALRETLARLLDPAHALLIDVHSFPPGTPNFPGDAEIVLMESWSEPRVTATLMRLLRKAGITVGYVQGHPTINDIELNARLVGMRAFLVEVREDIDDRRLALAMQQVSEFAEAWQTSVTFRLPWCCDKTGFRVNANNDDDDEESGGGGGGGGGGSEEEPPVDPFFQQISPLQLQSTVQLMFDAQDFTGLAALMNTSRYLRDFLSSPVTWARLLRQHVPPEGVADPTIYQRKVNSLSLDVERPALLRVLRAMAAQHSIFLQDFVKQWVDFFDLSELVEYPPSLTTVRIVPLTELVTAQRTLQNRYVGEMVSVFEALWQNCSPSVEAAAVCMRASQFLFDWLVRSTNTYSDEATAELLVNGLRVLATQVDYVDAAAALRHHFLVAASPVRKLAIRELLLLIDRAAQLAHPELGLTLTPSDLALMSRVGPLTEVVLLFVRMIVFSTEEDAGDGDAIIRMLQVVVAFHVRHDAVPDSRQALAAYVHTWPTDAQPRQQAHLFSLVTPQSRVRPLHVLLSWLNACVADVYPPAVTEAVMTAHATCPQQSFRWVQVIQRAVFTQLLWDYIPALRGDFVTRDHAPLTRRRIQRFMQLNLDQLVAAAAANFRVVLAQPGLSESAARLLAGELGWLAVLHL